MLDARTSLEKYRSGCRTLENFIIMPYGGVNRRPGTEFIADLQAREVPEIFFFNHTTASMTGIPNTGVVAIINSWGLQPGDIFTLTGNFTMAHAPELEGQTFKVDELSQEGPGMNQYIVLSNATTGVPIPWSYFAYNVSTQAQTPITAQGNLALSDDDNRSRLFPFNYSTTTRYVIEFGHHFIRIWSGGNPPALDFTITMDQDGDPWNTNQGNAVPYKASDLADLQIAQINDVIYIAHPSYPFAKLSRYGPGDWLWTIVRWDFPPTMEENTDNALTITPTGSVGTELATITLTASAQGRGSGTGFWRAGDVGSYWVIGHRRETAFAEVSLISTATGSATQVLGSWELTTTGTWAGNLFLERSEDNGTTWEVVRSWNSVSDRNYTTTGTQETPALMRLRFTKSGSGTNTGRALLTLSNARHLGVVRIGSITSGLIAQAEVIVPLFGTTATHIWSEAAFSDFRGHPSVVTLHEQRLYLAGNNARVQTFWASVVDDFQNFRTGVNDADAIQFTLAATDQNKIEWILSQNRLLIGTTGDEWTLEGSDDQRTITATNIRATRQSRYGSANIQALLLAEVVLFVQRNARKVRELTYSYEKDGWIAVDLTLLAEHITRGGIKEISYQQQPDAILWTIRGDGQLVGMTYERDQNVVGWHRQTTQGSFESVATIHGNGTEDEVWFVVRRVVDGQPKRYLERFSLNWRFYLDEGDKENWWYLDCAKRITNEPASATVAGLEHLEGLTVAVVADGVERTAIVESGEITLESPASNILVGLPYISTLEAMKLDTTLPDGTAQGRKMRIHGVVVRVYQSLGGEAQANGGTWRALGAQTEPFTGDHREILASKFGITADLCIRQSEPWPLTLIALIPKWDVFGSE